MVFDFFYAKLENQAKITKKLVPLYTSGMEMRKFFVVNFLYVWQNCVQDAMSCVRMTDKFYGFAVVLNPRGSALWTLNWFGIEET